MDHHWLVGPPIHQFTHLRHGFPHCQSFFLSNLGKLIGLEEEEGCLGLFYLGRHFIVFSVSVSSVRSLLLDGNGNVDGNVGVGVEVNVNVNGSQ